ncbi:GNAT family N-acetyltransferase [Vibrio sp.]|nr:GNAT family N-acetyltransferase [Vibrio sp.]
MRTKVSTPASMYKEDDDIIVRCAEVMDAQLIVDFYLENKAHLQHWEPKRETAFYTHSGWTQRLLGLLELQKRGMGFYIIILSKTTGTMLGSISISQLCRFPLHGCNIGYALDEHSQGQGIMSRSVKFVVDYLFTIHNLHRISAAYMPHNKKSESVLTKLGFEKEGFLKNYLLINDEWQDHILTSLINPNFQYQ